MGHAPEVLARLQEAAALGDRDPEPARHFGAAAFIIGAFDLALPFLRTAVDGLRAEGRLGHLPRGLMLYGTVAARLADWNAAAAGRAQTKALPDPKAEMSDVPIRPEKSDNGITMKINQWAADTYPMAQKHLDTARMLKEPTKKRSTN